MDYGPLVELKVNLSSPPRKRGSNSVDSRFRGNDVRTDMPVARTALQLEGRLDIFVTELGKAFASCTKLP